MIVFAIKALSPGSRTKTADCLSSNNDCGNDRLLDPNNASVTLDTIERAARVIGKRVRFELADVVLSE